MCFLFHENILVVQWHDTRAGETSSRWWWGPLQLSFTWADLRVFIHPFTALLKISVVATRSRNMKEDKTQRRVVLSNAERSQCHRPPSLPDRAEAKRDTGVLSGSVGVEGKRVKSKQAGGLRAVLLGKNSLSTSHLQFTEVTVTVREVSTERRQPKNNTDLKRKEKKKKPD